MRSGLEKSVKKRRDRGHNTGVKMIVRNDTEVKILEKSNKERYQEVD